MRESKSLMISIIAALTGLEHGSCIISTRDQGTSYIVGSDISDDWGSEPTEATQKNEPVISQIPQKTTPKQPSQQPPPIQWERTSWRQLKVEIAMIALIVIYFVNIFLGRRENDKIAKAFAQTFCSPGGVFDKNFTMVGIGRFSLGYLPYSTGFRISVFLAQLKLVLYASLNAKPNYQ